MDGWHLLVEFFDIFFVLTLGAKLWIQLAFATLGELDGFQDVVLDENA